MEINHRQKSSSGDKFKFPNISPAAVIDGEAGGFEFGCNNHVSPGSPKSPADHLFFNGRLLPHAFPCQLMNNSLSLSRSASRTSNISSKDSFVSSRSNSINSSRSSSCSSARTSTSESSASDHHRSKLVPAKVSKASGASRDQYPYCYQTKKPAVVLTPHYSSSQRWQFITPAPALKHQSSSSSRTRKSTQMFERGDDELKESKKKTKDWTSICSPWFGWRFFKSFVSACKECHAIKPTSTKYVPKN